MTKLQLLLNEKGLKQKDLVARVNETYEIGLTKVAVNKMCRGVKTNLHTNTILKICHVLDCTPNDIIEKDAFMKKMSKKRTIKE